MTAHKPAFKTRDSGLIVPTDTPELEPEATEPAEPPKLTDEQRKERLWDGYARVKRALVGRGRRRPLMRCSCGGALTKREGDAPAATKPANRQQRRAQGRATAKVTKVHGGVLDVLDLVCTKCTTSQRQTWILPKGFVKAATSQPGEQTSEAVA